MIERFSDYWPAKVRDQSDGFAHDDGFPSRNQKEQHGTGALAKVEGFIGSYPLAFLGAALAVGGVLGWWVKRK